MPAVDYTNLFGESVAQPCDPMSFDAFMIELAQIAPGMAHEDDLMRPYWERGLEPMEAYAQAREDGADYQ